jgi:hypothetical protein
MWSNNSTSYSENAALGSSDVGEGNRESTVIVSIHGNTIIFNKRYIKEMSELMK